uniref:Uncharacterized protein n=1 Tax=Arundo donax TaxID=35708 RepID=A0A0A8YLK5_ARUDO
MRATARLERTASGGAVPCWDGMAPLRRGAAGSEGAAAIPISRPRRSRRNRAPSYCVLLIV